MNGPQDLGGRMGFGPIQPEADEPVFHADWEKRALGLTLCAGAAVGWNIDESRHARESLHPADYYASTYYEIWIKGLETLLTERGFLSTADVAAGVAVDAPPPHRKLLAIANVPAMLAKGGRCDRPLDAPPKFKAGDRVRTRNLQPVGHTRLPAYARGKVGVIDAVRQAFVFPDTNAHGHGEQPQWVYTVVFDQLWGETADPGLQVSIDAWEPYLAPA